jgi:Ca2+-transporting ATPase
MAWNNNAGLLNVPGARSRGNSVDSATDNGESNSTGTYVASSQGDTLKGDLGPTEIMNDKDALKPDPGTEADFEVENNKFAFSPGQLGKLYNPKSVSTSALIACVHILISLCSYQLSMLSAALTV